jgi:mannose-6-phosphate isomerase-like protein (cupin superfamily)
MIIKKDERPWGNFKVFLDNEKGTVKILFVKKGEEISYQSHKHRDESWHVISGKGVVVIDDVEHLVEKDKCIEIKRGQKHCVKADEDLTILEISRGMFDENDIIRYKDKYNR